MSPSPSMLPELDASPTRPDNLRRHCAALELALQEERHITEQLRHSNTQLQASVNELCDKFKTLSVEYAARIEELEEDLAAATARSSHAITRTPSAVTHASPSPAAGGGTVVFTAADEEALRAIVRANQALQAQVAALEQQLQDQATIFKQMDQRRDGTDDDVQPRWVDAAVQTTSSFVMDVHRSAALIDMREKHASPVRSSHQPVDGNQSPYFGSLSQMKNAVRELELINIAPEPVMPTLPALRLVASVDPDASPTLRLMRALHYGSAGGCAPAVSGSPTNSPKSAGPAPQGDAIGDTTSPQRSPSRGREASPFAARKEAVSQLERLVQGACLYNQQLVERSDRGAVFFDFMKVQSSRVKKRELAMLALADELGSRAA